MYKPTRSKEIIERVEHIRALLRQLRPTTQREALVYERRESRLKDLITNLRRTNGRPMVQMLDGLETECLLTKDGAYRLFGYDLDAIRGYDLYLNGGRTHIVESYVFQRDLPVELPLELEPEEAFTRDALLKSLVRNWQNNIPIAALDRLGWHHRGAFYVHIGTKDSLGSSLPPGATALVVPLSEEEARQPSPRSTYLLQFSNGYRCSRCVVTHGRLHLLTNERKYRGPEAFPYPSGVRIAGRLRAFALQLPSPEISSLRGLWTYPGSAELILPWEHLSRWSLLATEHKRFVRVPEEQRQVEELMKAQLNPRLSDRTRRRYRSATESEPHADALIQMSVEHYARYSDLLRAGGRGLHDSGRFSLEAMLQATRFSDLSCIRAEAAVPTPSDVWAGRRRELGEYGALFALKFPKPSILGDRVIRLAKEVDLPGLEQCIRSGSWIALEELPARADTIIGARKRGWEQPFYALRRGLDMAFGVLEREEGHLALLTRRGSGTEIISIGADESRNLRRLCGVLMPM